jgi:hypothetical protein
MRKAGLFPPQVIRREFKPTNANHEYPLERRPADRPRSRTGVHEEPFISTGGRIDFIV